MWLIQGIFKNLILLYILKLNVLNVLKNYEVSILVLFNYSLKVVYYKLVIKIQCNVVQKILNNPILALYVLIMD